MKGENSCSAMKDNRAVIRQGRDNRVVIRQGRDNRAVIRQGKDSWAIIRLQRQLSYNQTGQWQLSYNQTGQRQQSCNPTGQRRLSCTWTCLLDPFQNKSFFETKSISWCMACGGLITFCSDMLHPLPACQPGTMSLHQHHQQEHVRCFLGHHCPTDLPFVAFPLISMRKWGWDYISLPVTVRVWALIAFVGCHGWLIALEIDVFPLIWLVMALDQWSQLLAGCAGSRLSDWKLMDLRAPI